MILGTNPKRNDSLIVLGRLSCRHCCPAGTLIPDGVGGGMKRNLRAETCICPEVQNTRADRQFVGLPSQSCLLESMERFSSTLMALTNVLSQLVR